MQKTKELANSPWELFTQLGERLIYWSPWISMGLLAIFALLITLQYGAYPTYGQPDPKYAGVLSTFFYVPLISFLVFTLSTFLIGIPLAIQRAWKSSANSKARQLAIFYLFGVSFYVVVFVFDAANLMEWLMD